LEIYGRANSFAYRLIGDDDLTPALHDENLFEIISPEIPENWIFCTFPGPEWQITPAEWAADGFWTAYFDGDPEARAVFAKVNANLDKRRN